MATKVQRNPLASANTASLKSNQDHSDQSIIRLWILRILVLLKTDRKFFTSFGFDDKQLACWLGFTGNSLDDDESDEEEVPTRKLIFAVLAKQHRLIESQAHLMQVPSTLANNVARIAALVNLNQVESRILEFVLLMHSSALLKQACEYVSKLENQRLSEVMAIILDQDVGDVRQAFKKNGALSKTGLISVRMSSNYALDDKLDLLSENLPHRLMEAEVEPADWLKDMIQTSGPGHLAFEDYAHCTQALQVIRPYLRQSVSEGRQGVNILLYGPPGTGKTQLAKLLAKDLACDLFEVTTEDEQEEPISGSKRLKALSATNSFFANRQALVMFDEIEDAFTSPDDASVFTKGYRYSNVAMNKGWINRLLETNHLPTLWIGNSLASMDPAFIRRFDVVLEMPVPPKSQRERIIRQASAGLLDEPTIGRMALSEHLTPAVITRSSRVVQNIASQLTDGQKAKAMELLINQTLQAQRHPAIARHNATALPGVYDPALVNTDTDLLAMADQMRLSKTGRICLYGPPGTGKTAYGRWLAEQLQMPLHVKRASDLISMWVGGTEQNIAQAFAQAEEEGALLLIDEVDSFLQDRQGAQRSWEVTQVNEMLTQMEAFNGVFIASTNLMQGLDPASLRRFDLKLKFDYLKAPQALQLLESYCLQLGLPAPEVQDSHTLGSLDQLTPGDYAAVVRQSRMRPVQSAAQMVHALAQECALKPGAPSRGMGFLP